MGWISLYEADTLIRMPFAEADDLYEADKKREECTIEA